MSIDQKSPNIDVDFHPIIENMFVHGKDLPMQVKFVVFEYTADTLRRMVSVFLDFTDHSIEAENVEKKNVERKITFVGAGSKTLSATKWGSNTCFRKYGKDRPRNADEAEMLIDAITQAINIKVEEVKGAHRTV